MDMEPDKEKMGVLLRVLAAWMPYIKVSLKPEAFKQIDEDLYEIVFDFGVHIPSEDEMWHGLAVVKAPFIADDYELCDDDLAYAERRDFWNIQDQGVDFSDDAIWGDLD